VADDREERLTGDILAAAAAGATPKPAPDAEQVMQRRDGDTLEARSTSRRIKTVEDLLNHIEADMTLYEVAASEATSWEVATAGNDGEATVTELHRVWVRLKPKAGPSTKEIVEAMISAASLPRAKQRPHKPKKRSDLWAVHVVADVHFGKYAWSRTTGGGDYDLPIAERLVGESAEELLGITDSYSPARRTILFLGDLFHYDTPHGSTTSGTPLERDGRMPKMIQVGCDMLLGIVERSAAACQTDVAVVSGNHDEALTFAFQRIVLERFRNDCRVTVSDAVTSRQYVSHGANLLGFAHGNRAKKRLPQIMALEAAADWARCWYREYHTGHFHSQAAEWQRPIETIDGVIVRTAPAICPPDDWHAASGFIGSRQAMEAFVYRPEGGLAAMHIAGPTP
jgi:UDP-2,3-diacylglucosamine pyrophosphatase LpxH